MNVRGLLAAAVLLAVLGVGVYFSNKAKEAEEKKGPAGDSPKVVSIPEDQFQRIEIVKQDGRNTVLKKTDKWQIVEPEALAVDTDAVNGMVTALSSLASERLVEENAANVAEFGLTRPQLQVIVTKKDGKTVKVLIGDETPTASGFFAKVDGENKVYTIGSFNKTSLDKTHQDLRDKRLVAFDSDKLTRVELNARGQTLEFGKNSQNEWQIVKPKPMRADNWAVEEVVRKLRDAKMDIAVTAEDSKKADAAFASGKPLAVAKVTDAAGTQQIEVRKAGADYYARGSAVAGVHKVNNELGEGLDKGIDDFRNKKLFDFGFNDPTRIEVKAAGQAKTYSKSGEKWTLDGKEMDSVSVQSFVDKIRDLASIKLLDSGFKEAVLEVTVTAKDGKLVDKVLFSKDGNYHYAMRDKEPSVYEIDGKAFEELQKAAGDIKPPSARKDEKKK